MVEEALLIFPRGTTNRLFYRLFHDVVGALGTTGLPGGTEFCYPNVTAGELTGDAVAYAIPLQYKVTEPVVYLKVYMQNDTASALFGAVVYAISVTE